MDTATIILAAVAGVSFCITLWQFVVAVRFPLHRRAPAGGASPGFTLLKPLKGCDAETLACLQSWLRQEYAGPVQVLFGVAAATDPACEVVRGLLQEFPQADAKLVICPAAFGANAKVSKLIQLEGEIRHELVVISDADVRVTPDLLANLAAMFAERENALVTCFYSLANPTTPAMRWEAVAINSDFWSQVLQAHSFLGLKFALGAVMAVRREKLAEIGGFRALENYLADDYQLGNLVTRAGGKIALCPVVVECWEAPRTWAEVFRHQLRWARTIRVCQPIPYFFSILGNTTFFTVLMMAVNRQLPVMSAGCALLAARASLALLLQYRLTRTRGHVAYDFMVWVKDLLQAVIWALAFLGSTIEWRGQRYRVDRGGKLTQISAPDTRSA